MVSVVSRRAPLAAKGHRNDIDGAFKTGEVVRIAGEPVRTALTGVAPDVSTGELAMATDG
ncbi:MAG TPA: hypothetical protein VF069_29995 [Streptosporangiaceae bacterium]